MSKKLSEKVALLKRQPNPTQRAKVVPFPRGIRRVSPQQHGFGNDFLIRSHFPKNTKIHTILDFFEF